jgi:hypothetical protein
MHSNEPIVPEPTSVEWLPVFYADAKMVDLDVGRDGIVWGCTATGAPIVREGITHLVEGVAQVNDHSGTSWTLQGDDVITDCSKVAVCTSGHVWVITQSMKVFFRDGIYKENIIGQGWTLMNPGNMEATDVACGGQGQIWMTDVNRNLYTKTGTEDAVNPQGDIDPVTVDNGDWTSISVGENGQLFGL